MVVRLSALRTGRFYPARKYSWYSFLLEAGSIPGPQCGRKDYVNEKFQWYIGNRTRDQPRHRVPRVRLTHSISPSVSLSLQPHGTRWFPLTNVSIYLIFQGFFLILLKKFEIHQNLTIIRGTSQEDLCIFMTKSRWIAPKMKNIS